MSSGLLFGTNSIFAKIDTFTSFGLDRKLDDMLGLTPPETQGPRISDLSVQTSTFGAHIPRLYGTVAVMGNLLWLENNKLKESVQKKKSGGKGGGGGAAKPTTTYSYSATFHISLCEGPIAGIRRMWCGDILLYNAGSDDLETIIASNQAAKGWKLYLGTDSQLPDSRYEADVGVGTASAHRGLAYIAFYDFQLEDYSNTLQAAQFKIEVVSAQSLVNSVVNVDMPRTARWHDVAWGAFGFLSVGTVSADGVGAFSADGRAWSAVALPPSLNGGLVSAGNGCYVSVPGFGAQSGVSKTGRSWILTDLPAARSWTLLHFTGAAFLLVAGSQFTQSTNGTGWSALASTPSSSQWRAAVTMGAVTFMVSSSGPANSVPRFAIYADGTWSESVMADVGALWTGLASDGATLCAVGYGISAANGALGHYATSIDDGLTWIYGRIPVGGYFEDVCYGGGQFVAIGNYFGISYIYASPDPRSVPWARIDTGAFKPESIAYNGAWFVITGFELGTAQVLRLATQAPTGIGLGVLIATEVSLSALVGATDIDVSAVVANVNGYRVSGGDIRAALEPLRDAFPFDAIQSGYKIKCVPRGQASLATIPWMDLGATDGDAPRDILQQSREMDSQLPARTTVKYLDAAREYATSEQYSDRINTEAVNRVERDLPLVLSADEAAGAAEVLQNMAWLERTDLAFSLPATYLHHEVADVVTLDTPDAAYEVRLTEINYGSDGRLECKAKPSRAALYVSSAVGGIGGAVPSDTISLPGAALFLPLDIPVVSDLEQNALGFVGIMTGYTNSWPGGAALRTGDGGQTWTTLQAYAGKATLGEVAGLLPASNGALIDRRALLVGLLSGELESITRDQMLTGNNYAAYGMPGRWEIVRFQTAALQSVGSYLVSDFVRGDRGTEWATGLHQEGDWFVLLDDADNAFIGMPLGMLSQELIYRGVTSGGSIDEADDVRFTYRGVNLECLSPVNAVAQRDGSGSVSASFTRRTRLSSSWWANGVSAPVGETPEAYEIDVMDGVVVVRTIAVTAPTFNYSTTEQTADFGSTQPSIIFRIYQLSQYVGRGYSLEVTL